MNLTVRLLRGNLCGRCGGLFWAGADRSSVAIGGRHPKTHLEKEIADKDLPKVVARALEDKHPKATHKTVEEIVKVEKKEEKPAYYEVKLKTAKKKSVEVQVTADGKIVKEEEGSDKDGNK